MVESAAESVSKAVVDLTEKTLIRVLHVDDEAGFLKSAKQCLEMQGAFHVETASSVEEAMEKMKEKTFDIIISDYVMPEKSGLEFLKELRESGNNIPFIMFTGKGREEVAVKALNLGADHYINKIGAPEAVYGELAHSISQAVETRKTEKALRDANEKWVSLIENTDDLIIIIDRKGMIRQLNKTIPPYTLEETIGKSVYKYVPQEQHEIIRESLRGVFKTGKPDSFEISSNIPKIGTMWFRTKVVPIKHDREPVSAILVSTDITERKKADVRLRESEKKFRDIFENANDVIVYGDLKGTILDLNQKAAEFAGIEKEKILGKNFGKLGLVSFRDVPKLLGRLARKALGKANTENFQLTITKKDGKKRFLEVNSTLIRRGKMPAGFLAIARDITERRETQERVEKMNEKLEVVGKLIRHDLRNKLSAVVNNVYLAKQGLTDNPETLEYLSEVESSVEQAKRILEFATIYERLGIEELAYIDVESNLKAAVTLFSDLQGVNVVNDCHGLTVLADSLLRQLFYNLIDNSLKHGERVSRIRVHYEEAGKDHLKLVYEDDGVGIPKAEKEKSFMEGYGKDSGYGLFLIRKMCKVYGWTVRETGKHGKGTQFTITIPKMNESGKIAYRLH